MVFPQHNRHKKAENCVEVEVILLVPIDHNVEVLRVRYFFQAVLNDLKELLPIEFVYKVVDRLQFFVRALVFFLRTLLDINIVQLIGVLVGVFVIFFRLVL